MEYPQTIYFFPSYTSDSAIKEFSCEFRVNCPIDILRKEKKRIRAYPCKPLLVNEIWYIRFFGTVFECIALYLYDVYCTDSVCQRGRGRVNLCECECVRVRVCKYIRICKYVNV